MNGKRESLAGYLFLFPSLLGFGVFLLFPIAFSFVLSFSNWDLVSGIRNIQFIGIQNFINLWSDPKFVASLRNNIVYTLITVPVTLLVALIVAVILNDKVYGRNLLRLLYFLPYITTIVAVSVIWMALYHPRLGPINQFLISIGIENPPMWLGDATWALPSIIIMMIWVSLGFSLVIYMAGLQGIPKELYEAAEVDGATALQKFTRVTIPLLSPTTFFLVITQIIHTFEVFTPVNIMTQGGPGDATSVLVYYIYKVSFNLYQFGYGSAIAWVMFLIIFFITLIQWYQQKKWVTYN